MRSHVLAVTPAVVLGMLLSGCTAAFRADEPLSLRFAWQDFEQVTVSTHNGRITFAQEDGLEEIRVEGLRWAYGASPQAAEEHLEHVVVEGRADSGDPGRFRIDATVEAPARHASAGAHLDVRVPREVAVEIRARNGRVEVRRVNGPSEVVAANGRVLVEDVSGPLRVHTSNGEIECRRIAGNVTVETSNGSVRLQQIGGSVDVETSNGSVDLDAVPAPEGCVRVRSRNGRITARLSALLRGRLLLHTSNGSIRTDLGSMSLTRPDWSRNRIEAEANGGGEGCIELITSNGSITLECR